MQRKHLIKVILTLTCLSFILAYQNCAAPLDEGFIKQLEQSSTADTKGLVGGDLKVSYEISGKVQLGSEFTLSIIVQGGDGIYTYSLKDKNGQVLGLSLIHI